MRSIRLTVVAVVAILSIAVAFAVGLSLGQRSMLAASDKELRNVQAMLVFNRILDERRLQALMSRGCVSQAADEISFNLDKDMELLSHYIGEGLDAQTQKYISDRDSTLLKELQTFKSKYGDAWAEKACQSSQ